jgi:hypothetical protein
MSATPTSDPKRILVVGRSPSVLLDTVEILRKKGYSADATNQFERVLDDYDVKDIDILVFGGMVPPDTKQYLREEIAERNAHVTFVQGLAGIAGLIAAQVEGVVTAEPGESDVAYDAARRSVQLSLTAPARVVVDAWWSTSFTPPEPSSTSMQVHDAELDKGSHIIPLPAEVPSEASFVTVAVGPAVHAFTVGAMPQSVLRMVPTGGMTPGGDPSPSGRALPPVSAVSTHSQNR